MRYSNRDTSGNPETMFYYDYYVYVLLSLDDQTDKMTPFI